jgi:hypothetical protein
MPKKWIFLFFFSRGWPAKATQFSLKLPAACLLLLHSRPSAQADASQRFSREKNVFWIPGIFLAPTHFPRYWVNT